MRIPKFRNTTRLVKWMKRMDYWERLPSSHEEVFFTVKKEEGYVVAYNLTMYCWRVGKLEPRFENLLIGHPDSVIEYAKILKSKQLGEISEELKVSLKGVGRCLFQLAELYERRLPKELEDTMEDPAFAYRYAKDILCGRLPSHLEPVFFKNTTYASKYAFDVIRGFAPVKLPDDLHSFMIMKSFENPDDHNIKIYMQASESDPNKTGNSVRAI